MRTPTPFELFLMSEGYVYPREHGGKVCAVKAFIYTTAIVTGITLDDYEGRYCFATSTEAVEALKAWKDEPDPPGNWIKYKGIGGERLGPGATTR